MKLSIKKFQQINRKITLDLDKITIVTGVNGVGKTNISKLLYCLLKANCYKRYEPAVESINKKIDELIKKIHSIHKIELYLPEPEDVFGYIDNYLTLKEEFKVEHHALYNDYYKDDFDLLDRLIEIVYSNGLELHISLLRTLLKGMYGTANFTGEVELTGDDGCFYKLDFNQDFYNDTFLEYADCAVFDNVFYFDNSGTFLDYMEYNGIFNCIHMNDMNDACVVDKSTMFDNNDDLIELENELVDIVGGYFEYDGRDNLVFRSKSDNTVYSMGNVSSGMRSLGCLYLLLHYRHIGEGSFLIFDEFECNLHTKTKLFLGEWLCKLVKKIGVHIYVNTKSPLFIETLEVYSMKYKLGDNVSYILLDYSKDNQIKTLNTDRWGVHILYDNLGDPYDIIDEQRIANTFNL